MKFFQFLAVFTAILGLSSAAIASSPDRFQNEESELLLSNEILINGKSMKEIMNFAKDLSNFERNQIKSLNLGSDILLDDEDEDGEGEENKTGPGSLEWATGLASGLAITLCSVCGVLLIPITSKWWYKRLLLYLIATATSSLRWF